MIITIKGADFSAKNIGTLSTWTILTNLGSGATYSGNRVVDKDSSLSATITIANEYKLGSAGVSVIMGSTNVTSSAVTVNGNIITISIATVTDNVTINVPTLVTGGEIPNYAFTINPTPSNATVTLTASGHTQNGNSITVPNGTTVSWSVSADGYTTRTGVWTINGGNKTENITLVATGDSGGQITTTYNLSDFVNVNTGRLNGNVNTWIHSDFIPVNDLSNSTEDDYCVRTFVGHGTVAAIAFYSQPNFDSYEEGFILSNTAGNRIAQTAEEVRASITKENANYVVFSTDGSKATLSVTTGEGSTVTPDPEEPEVPEEPENPNTGTSGVNYYEEAGYILFSSGQITNPSSTWIHSDFIPISELEDDASLGHCIGKFTGHAQVADIAFYSSNNFNSFIVGKTSAGPTKTVSELQALMTDLNATGATHIVISTDKSKNQLYANLK